MAKVWLNKGRERSVRRRHPWVFSGAINGVEGDVHAGDVVTVHDSGGAFLGRGYYCSGSQIRVRIVEWEEGVEIDDAWWQARVKKAAARRDGLPTLRDTNMRRLVHGEADGLSGLIVDAYGEYAVVQALTAGVDRAKETIAQTLMSLSGIRGVYERSDSEGRKAEGLRSVNGQLAGEAPPNAVEVAEGDVRYMADLRGGHKTGFYIDQRENRPRVAAYANGRSILDMFCYGGGFAVHALHAGAEHATLVDSSAESLTAAEHNLRLNNIQPSSYALTPGNGFDVLRSFRDTERRFDMVILDPPKFAQTRGQMEKAERAYKDINLIAMKILNPSGILATFSCSGAVDGDTFLRFVSWAALDAGRTVQVLERLSQPPDHPISPTFPESEYLKGLICRVE